VAKYAKYLNQFKTGRLSPNEALMVSAGVLAIQSGAMVFHLVRIAKVGIEYEKRSKFLLDIVQRNTEHLEEFDLIALRDMGMIKEIKDAVE
jgi:hypothetical protein